MKRFCNKVICSCIVALVVIILCGVFQDSQKYVDHNLLRLKEVEEYHNIDVLFVGSSQTYRAFDTQYFRKKNLVTFNLGSSAQTPIETEVLLHKYLRLLNPKMVVVESMPDAMKNSGKESCLNILACMPPNTELIKLSLMILDRNIITELINSLFTYYIFKKDIPYVSKNMYDKYIKGGYVETNCVGDLPVEVDENEITVNSKQWDAFARNINFIRAGGFDYMIIELPVPRVKYHSYINHDMFVEKVKRYGAFVNFNEIVEFEDDCFYDLLHLNKRGASLLCDEFYKMIYKNYIQTWRNVK